MVKYILKRLGYIVFVFFVVSIILFFLYNSIPGDRALTQVAHLSGKVSQEQYEEAYRNARDKLGLDDPMIFRYGKWMKGILSGDLGYSTYFKRDVIDSIKSPIQTTVFINIFATIIALTITIFLGIQCAVRKNSIFDKIVQVLSIVGYSLPQFIISLVLIFIFAVQLNLFPVSGMNSPDFQGGTFDFIKDRLYYLALPLAVMTIASLGGMTRYVRAAMIDALSMDYIRTARAKGLKEKTVIYSHAWRNALLPVITLIIGWFISIFAGSLIIENMFSLNGMGKLYITGLMNQDYDLAMAIQLFYMVVSLIGNLIIDLSYGIVDPRVRITK